MRWAHIWRTGPIRTSGNAQEATGDTMNDGTIIVNGNCGDGTGYGMRGGKIFIRGNVGYRAGIHMKAYREKKPLLVVGGNAGSFLGEYQAGGTIIVLNLNGEESIVGNFCGTGMHGGKMYLRCEKPPATVSEKVDVRIAGEADLRELYGPIEEFCSYFGYDPKVVLDHPFYVLEADTKIRTVNFTHIIDVHFSRKIVKMPNQKIVKKAPVRCIINKRVWRDRNGLYCEGSIAVCKGKRC